MTLHNRVAADGISKASGGSSYRSKMNSLAAKIFVATLLLAVPLVSSASPITLGSPLTRQATLGNATSGFTVDGNPQNDDISGAFGGLPTDWTKVGDVNKTNGISNGFLTITMSGSWGDQPSLSGTWTISDSFFDIYGTAVISMHVGGANQAPDGFAWLVTEKSGTWSYDINALRGGGLSNLGLWGSGEPTNSVPDGSSTAVLLGLGLVSLCIAARRKLSC
jgi:hypothetical protein